MMETYVLINNEKVFCCDKCPRNKEFPNRLLRFLPPEHHCIDMFDPVYKEGKLITFSRNYIPDWCPYGNR
jgi:hypothetical protein